MRSIADVIRDVIDNTDAADIGSQAAADRLSKELIDALLAAGHPVIEPPTERYGGEMRLHGVATIRLDGAHKEGEPRAVADLTADVNLFLTPVITEGRETWDGQLVELGPDRVVRYDVWLEGFTVPRDGQREHLRLMKVDPT